MMERVRLSGPRTRFSASLATALRGAGLTLDAGDTPTGLLVALPESDTHVIATAREFAAAAAAAAPGASPAGAPSTTTGPAAGLRAGALIVTLIESAARGDWPALHTAASVQAFIRHAALAWAPCGIRINGLVIGPPSTDNTVDRDAAATSAAILGMMRWQSMTGQTIRLCGP